MTDNIQIPHKFFTSFNNILYYDEPHKYYVNKKELISVTTLIHKYVNEFEEDYWANIKAEKYNVKPYEIKRAWKFINVKGTLKGSIIHDYAENRFLNKQFEYPKKLILNQFGFDPIREEYLITKKLVNKFHNDVRGKLIPIRTEYVICDMDSMIAGMLDMIFWNVKAQEFQIFDWKTNKEFTFECKERHLIGDLFLLEESDMEIYSLQLELYKYIIEKYVGIKLGKSYVVWFSHNNKNYKVIEMKNRRYYIERIIANRMNELN